MRIYLATIFAAFIASLGQVAIAQPGSIKCLNLEQDGSQTLLVLGKGRNRTDAIEQAKKEAVYEVLFNGVQNGNDGYYLRPLIVEVNARERYREYFDIFFLDGGEYLKYISMADCKSGTVRGHNDSVQQTYSVTVRVLVPELRTRLSNDGILGDVATPSIPQKNINLPQAPSKAKYIDYSVKPNGWWCSAQFSSAVATTAGDTYAGAFQLDIINGYRFSEYLKLGLGLSPRIYTSASNFPLDDNRLLFGIYSLPIYLDARGNFISQEDRMFAPYWNVSLGYAVNEGLYFSPCAGMRFGGIRHNFLVGINYTLQGHNVGQSSKTIHMLGVRIGYEF